MDNDKTSGRVWAVWYEKTPDTPQVAIRSCIYYPVPEAGGICRKMTRAFDTAKQAQQWIDRHPRQNFYRPHVHTDKQYPPADETRGTDGHTSTRRPRPFRIYR